MQKHGKSYKILQFPILEIGVHLRNLRIGCARNPFWMGLMTACQEGENTLDMLLTLRRALTSTTHFLFTESAESFRDLSCISLLKKNSEFDLHSGKMVVR